MRLQPIHVVVFTGRRRAVPDPRAPAVRGGQIGNRCLGLDHAVMVQHIPQPNTPGPFGDVAAEHAGQKAVPVRPGDLEPVEPVYLAQPNVLMHIAHFARDNIKGLIKVKGKRRVKIRAWFDVFHPLPAIHHRERRAFGRHDRGQRRCLGIAPGGAMLVREMKAKFVLVILNRFQRRQLDIGVPGKAPRIKHPSVVTRLAVHNLLRQQPAMTAPLAQPCT